LTSTIHQDQASENPPGIRLSLQIGRAYRNFFFALDGAWKWSFDRPGEITLAGNPEGSIQSL